MSLTFTQVGSTLLLKSASEINPGRPGATRLALGIVGVP